MCNGLLTGNNFICMTFAILEFADDLINKSGLPVRKTAEGALIFIVSSHWRHLLRPHIKQLHEK